MHLTRDSSHTGLRFLTLTLAPSGVDRWFVRNDKTKFCYRRVLQRKAKRVNDLFCYRQVLQQQVKRSIAVGYAVWVAKSKTSQ